MESLDLHFNGPFSFSNQDNSLFHPELKNNAGIYLWVLQDIVNNINYIEYIGETTKFSKRQKEHLTHILGLNYRILDANKAKQGECSVLWNGMWRDKSDDAANNVMTIYDDISQSVISYVNTIKVFFAPTSCGKETRKHMEGMIAKTFRESHPELTIFYPSDNRTIPRKKLVGTTINITCDESIAGLERKLDI